jgi:DNA-directed RNA polymerase subunit H (RpoH/RPB5)
LGIRPGDIVKIERSSRTAIQSDFYRVCKLY